MHNRRSSSFSSITELFRPNNPRRLRSRDLSSTRLNALKKEIETNTHLIPLKDLYTRLGTDPVKGLTSDAAAELLEYYGPNTLTPTSHFQWPKMLLKCLFTGFSILIWFGAILCLLSYVIESSMKAHPSTDNLYLGCVLIAVDIICGLFSFFQNFKSSKILKTFNNMIPMSAKCMRDGVWNAEMPVAKLVKGDIVHVKAGDVIPADIRIIESKGFKVDNSSLTGESRAVTRSNTEGTTNILESQNVAFFSAQCVEGWAFGVVLCCGDLTALGRVAGLAARLEPAPSPLCREISRFMWYMSIWALGLGVFIAASSFILGYPFIQTTIFVIGIIVANIPEGLQPTITASLTLTAQRMVKKNCLVKNLEAIEALGAVTIICSDKTGTLTKNKMCVRDIWTWNRKYSILDPDFKDSLTNNKAIEALKTCGALCSSATIDENGEIHGDASETAILTFLCTYNDPATLRQNYPKIVEIPFNSTNKYQVSVHFDKSMSRYVVVMKGAPECILSRCNTVVVANNNVSITNEIKEAANKAIEDLATTGERVLAFADLILDPKVFPTNYEFDTEEVNFPLDGLRLIGIIGLKDPPREEPALRRADIGISMGITGSQVSKQTADIILMDDNFATIVIGIEEGRKIFDNLKKSVCYILISNVPEILPVLMFILFSIPLPLGVMTILCVDLGTDMWPAVSLSYEGAEADVMGRPPRHGDRLVSARMLYLVYGHLGLIEFAAGMYAYFTVMAEHGFYPSDLFGIRERWDNEAVTDVRDSLGQEWTYEERKELERACQASYFVAVVITQMMNGIICKTRFNSIFEVGMKNKVLNLGLVFELLLACILCYVPVLNDFFCTYPLRPQWWFLSVPFALLLLGFDEFRKYCIRKWLFDGWYNYLTYY
ncbi:PREDICTED: sodium/potassium-transporting ATPase subunit alpha-like [Papilio polytes]|uniref:sodium/potassium-transporting ATPase subunit alpha-like n=1 Tax=Papilio polytes TaxID=76194 RepID=UPI00067667D7|nr:PREDICTED: sodium/potassium-transporting ATPase subunit alpha-like [Papilio polytes]